MSIKDLWDRAAAAPPTNEIDEEQGFHIDMATQRNIARGMSPDEARRVALKNFGGVDNMREAVVDVRRTRWLEDFARDASHSLRMLLRAKSFALAAIITLALGIGANTAIFSVLEAVLLRPLPYDKPEQLVAFTPSTYAAYNAWTEDATSLASAGAYTYVPTNVGSSTGPQRVWSLAVTASLLPTLGVSPAIGRGFTAEDDVPNSPPRALLSHAFWTTYFAADPRVVGQSVDIDGRRYEVIGVLPETLVFPPPARHSDGSMPRAAEVWIGAGQLSDLHETGGFLAIARLADGASLQRAQDEITATWKATNPEGVARTPVIPAVGVNESVIAPIRPAILVFMGGVALILLIACANLGSLLLARLTSRNRELAVRVSLGASGSRVARQILTEGLMLAALGAAAGIAVAYFGLHAMLRLAPPELVRVQDATLSARVLLFTVLVSAVTALLIGALPALRVLRRSQAEAITSARGATHDRATGRVHTILVACEVALAVFLLIGAGLLARSYSALSNVDPGFDTTGLVTADILVPGDRYPDRPAVLQFMERVERELSVLPGVHSVSAIDRLPYGASYSGLRFTIAGQDAAEGDAPRAANASARPGYFLTMGIPIVRGREFTAADATDAPKVVVIGRVLADKYWPNGDAIGARIHVFGEDREVVGIAGDIRHLGPASPVEPMIYIPQSQDAATRRMMTVVVRTSASSANAVTGIRDVMRSVDSNLPLQNLRTFDALRAERTASQRFNALLITSFATLAILLAGVGIYGVMSFVVAQRTRDIGVRMALGATRASVLTGFMKRALVAASVGTAAGVAAAIPLSRTIESMLFGVPPVDLVTYVAVVLGVVAVTVLAAVPPSLRAARLDPRNALAE